MKRTLTDPLLRQQCPRLFHSRMGRGGFLLGMIFILFGVGSGYGQTDFAPGQIMFTGFNSDNPDGFSIVILADITSSTTIYITDRGWSSTTGFRDDSDGEGTISFQLNADYPCGTTIVFQDVGGTNDWAAYDSYGLSIGTVTILTSTTESPSQDPDGIEFNVGGGFPAPDGDQLFIYQLPEPSVSDQTGFVTGIHMNGGAWNAGNGDDYSSQKPTGLADNQVVRFNTEVDNAKYDCSPSTGTATALQAAIENDNGAGGLISDATNNWLETNNYTNLFPTCNFCCGSTPPSSAPEISGPVTVATNQVFTINITGTLAPGQVWELFTAGCGTGTPLQTTSGSSFTVTAPATEGLINYYVRTSEEIDCGAICDILTVGVCIDGNNMNTCTNCSANPQVCGDCFLPPVDDNPDLDSGCYAIKLIFILDESGSIGSNEPDVRAGVLAFLNAINGQDMEVALIEFSDLGRVVNTYTPVNNSYIQLIEGYFDNIAYNGQWYQPGGGTNWHDAMIKADAMVSADMILFFTDGVPTGWTNNGVVDYCGDGSTTQTPEIVNPVKIANKLKGEGTHMFMLGVGSGIDEENLQLMSGPIEYAGGMNTIGSADWSIGNFVDLAEDLEEFVDELCETPLDFDKQVLGAVCNGVQQFMFIIHNPGEESAATIIEVIDTFPSGYNNIVYNGPPGVKLCIGAACASQGQPQPDNAFIWTTNSLPPGESDTLILSVNVLPTGNYTNIGWAEGSNTALVSDTVTSDNITDDLPPTIACPANTTIECIESSLPSATGSATGMDPDGSTPTITYTDVIIDGACTGEYTINRTWLATDGCTNTAACVQVIIVEDNTPPEVDCPANITIQCDDSTLPANTGNLSATDCDNAPVLTYADVTMGMACGSTIQRTWTATDDCGNSSTCIQIIVLTDSVAPDIDCPSNVTISCTASSLPANTGGFATATDYCDADPDISYTDMTVSGPCSQEPTILRTWKALDGCGNFSTCIQSITVEDNIAPLVSCPPNVTIQCNTNTLPSATGSATSSDSCDPSPVITYSNSITGGDCPQEYSITRTWTSTDGCGNSSTCNQIITIVDTTPPAISCPANITIQCTGNTLPANTGSATATDNCGLSPAMTYNDVTVNGTCVQEYTIMRTWTATDECGNAMTCTQSIFLEDNLSPMVTCPADITIDCSESTLPANTGSPVSTDNCDMAPVMTYSDITTSGSCPQQYFISRTWTASDGCTNSSTCVQVITLIDTIPPVITCPADITIDCIDNTLPGNTGLPVLTDACDNAPVADYDDVTITGPTQDGYTIQRTWTAIDGCSNESTCLQIITVENPVDPEITGLPFDTICTGQSVIFTAENQGFGNGIYQWNFGSGASPAMATGIGPHTITYTHNGTNGTIGASVILSVTIDGCAMVTDTVANIHVNPLPVTTIDAPSTPLCYFKPRPFKPLGPPVPGYTYQWTFGAGADIPNATGYGPHVVEYSTTGSKTVQLVIESNEPGANCSYTTTLTFNVIECPGNITGRVRTSAGAGIGQVAVELYHDTNRDGLSDGGPFVRSVNTSPTGSYSMVGVAPGHYVIIQIQPFSYISLSEMDETNDNDSSVTNNIPNDNIIAATLEPQEIDAGNVFVESAAPGIIEGYVFDDFTNNGFPDDGEGIELVTIYLYADNDQNGLPDPGSPLDTAITNSLGWFVFEAALGDYVLKEVQPAGFTNIGDIDFTDDEDVVANASATDDIIPVTVILDETDSHNYFKENEYCNHVVNNLNNSGPGSLRYIIDCATSGDTIIFSSALANQVINITTDRIIINKNIYILSSVTPRISIQSIIPGAFLINSGFTAEFKNLNFRSGLAGYPGAAFENYGQLILWNSQIFRNTNLPPGNYLIYNGTPGMVISKGVIQIEYD